MANLTQEQVSELSDFELEKRIHKLRHPTFTKENLAGTHRKYCTSWNDLMPLVLQYDISILDGVAGHDFDYGYEDDYPNPPRYNEPDFKTKVADKPPQRALAECLFLVLQQEANNGN